MEELSAKRYTRYKPAYDKAHKKYLSDEEHMAQRRKKQHEYYLKKTKPKREAQRLAKLQTS